MTFRTRHLQMNSNFISFLNDLDDPKLASEYFWLNGSLSIQRKRRKKGGVVAVVMTQVKKQACKLRHIWSFLTNIVSNCYYKIANLQFRLMDHH